MAEGVTRHGPSGTPSLPYGDFSGKVAQTGEADIGAQTFPNVPIRSFRIDLNENKSITESVFTRRRQITSLSNGTSDRWEGLLTTPILSQANVRLFMNFMVVTGLHGLFTITHPDYTGPASVESDGFVNGASQKGSQLAVDGFTADTTILFEGEWFQIGNELKRMTADATTDGTGAVTLNFKPPIRVSPGDGDDVILNNPLLTAELTTIPGEETDSLRMMAFTIAFQEALISD
jgi:hypothetical protein